MCKREYAQIRASTADRDHDVNGTVAAAAKSRRTTAEVLLGKAPAGPGLGRGV
jgi:hypothetical protein